MRVLVCGGREFLDWHYLFVSLDNFVVARVVEGSGGITRVIEGGARGADTGGAFWAFCRGVPFDTYWANWTKYGRAAGSIRNQRMIDEGKPDVVYAFPGGKGTADMISRAKKHQIRVVHG